MNQAIEKAIWQTVGSYANRPRCSHCTCMASPSWNSLDNCTVWRCPRCGFSWDSTVQQEQTRREMALSLYTMSDRVRREAEDTLQARLQQQHLSLSPACIAYQVAHTDWPLAPDPNVDPDIVVELRSKFSDPVRAHIEAALILRHRRDNLWQCSEATLLAEALIAWIEQDQGTVPEFLARVAGRS